MPVGTANDTGRAGAPRLAAAVNPPIWVLFAVWLPVAAVLCLSLLRPLKGLMIAAQIRNKASQHRRDELD